MVSSSIFPSSFIFFLHSKEIFFLRSFLVNLGHFQFTSSIITTTLLVEIDGRKMTSVVNAPLNPNKQNNNN